MSDVTLGSVDDIPYGEGRAYAVEGRQIAVFRLRDGSLRAVDAVCPHRGGPLADGLTDDAIARLKELRARIIAHVFVLAS